MRRSDLLEKEYEAGSGRLIRWLSFFFAFLLLLYFSHFLPDRNLKLGAMIICSAIALASLVMAMITGLNMRKTAVETPTIIVACPYCDFAMKFTDTPTSDWECEDC